MVTDVPEDKDTEHYRAAVEFHDAVLKLVRCGEDAEQLSRRLRFAREDALYQVAMEQCESAEQLTAHVAEQKAAFERAVAEVSKVEIEPKQITKLYETRSNVERACGGLAIYDYVQAMKDMFPEEKVAAAAKDITKKVELSFHAGMKIALTDEQAFGAAVVELRQREDGALVADVNGAEVQIAEAKPLNGIAKFDKFDRGFEEFDRGFTEIAEKINEKIYKIPRENLFKPRPLPEDEHRAQLRAKLAAREDERKRAEAARLGWDPEGE